MKILITGGTGFIGRKLVAHLKVNHEVVVLSRQGSRAYSLLGHDIKLLDNLDRLDNLNDVDAVINLAGEPIAAGRWSESRKQLLCDSRWLLTEQLVDLIKLSSTPPKVLINASAIGWYGRQGTETLDEQCRSPNDEFTHQLCQQWETPGAGGPEPPNPGLYRADRAGAWHGWRRPAQNAPPLPTRTRRPHGIGQPDDELDPCAGSGARNALPAGTRGMQRHFQRHCAPSGQQPGSSARPLPPRCTVHTSSSSRRRCCNW